MNTTNFYYIGTGEKTMMYTLRYRWTETVVGIDGPMEFIRDAYIRNLSIDPEKAVEKARLFIGRATLKTDDIPSLEDIRRRESEEIQLAREAQEDLYEEQRASREAQKIEDILSGIWPFGKFHGQTFDSADKGYIRFWLEHEFEDEDSVVTNLKTALAKKFPEIQPLPKANGEYYGTEKKREEFTATLISESSYYGYYGQSYILRFVKDSGELLVFMGVNGYGHVEIGDTVTFKATVKCHEEYQGEKQTKIQRLKF